MTLGHTGTIINPRGAGGSGKTELVRRILAEYGWRQGAGNAQPNTIKPIYRVGRWRPFGYRFEHPHGGRPLVVLGEYSSTSGGCDTIRAADGGLSEIVRRAVDYSATGHDVLIEGLHLSADADFSMQLARRGRLHVLVLSTPAEQCARNLAVRRRLARRKSEMMESNAIAEMRLVTNACAVLQPHATVESLSFDAALLRAAQILGVEMDRRETWAAKEDRMARAHPHPRGSASA